MGIIKKLDESVVNRIAAGEIIHRPASAVKEMLENSLDAGATNIVVTTKDGGMKLLSIQDNGKGIAKDDLPIVCERYTTSKLEKFEDLKQITTYGFRGEALASISMIARVTITTRPAGATMAQKAHYQDGKLVAAKPNEPATPTPTAGRFGTTILVEDLFYNVPLRRKAITNPAEEHKRIVEIITRYAIRNHNVAFSCKRDESTTQDVNTASATSPRERIKDVFGASIASDLLEAKETLQVGPQHETLSPPCSSTPSSSSSSSAVPSTTFRFFTSSSSSQTDSKANITVVAQMEALFTNPSYSLSKKTTFILFINKRLVEHPQMKKAIVRTYEKALKGRIGRKPKPFVYLGIDIAPEFVDVNIHPTKQEVHFLHEEGVLKAITNVLEKKLKEWGTTLPSEEGEAEAGDPDVVKVAVYESPARVITNKPLPASQQTTLTPRRLQLSPNRGDQHMGRGRGEEEEEMDFIDTSPNATTTPRSMTSNPIIRTSPTSPTRLPFGQNGHTSSSSTFSNGSGKRMLQTDLDEVVVRAKKARNNMRLKPATNLKSIIHMWQQVVSDEHEQTAELMSEFALVAPITQRLSIIETKDQSLYLIDHCLLSKDIIYQNILLHFQRFNTFKLNPVLSIRKLISYALDDDPSLRELLDSFESKEDQILYLVKMFHFRAAMLEEYFGVVVQRSETDEKEAFLEALPYLLDGYQPPLGRLPSFLVRLGTALESRQEEECLNMCAMELADLYAYRHSSASSSSSSSSSKSSSTSDASHLQEMEIAGRGGNYKVFTKKGDFDHPLQRAVDYCQANPTVHLFAKEFNSGGGGMMVNKHARYFITQDVNSFFQYYSNLPGNKRFEEDVVRESLPVKFYADLEFDLALVENRGREAFVSQMMMHFKEYVEQQWKRDLLSAGKTGEGEGKGTGSGKVDVSSTWLEFDASAPGIRVSRHCHNDSMVFADIEHLFTFMKRIEARVNADIAKGLENACSLVVCREKRKEKKKELFFDMMVYNKNRCFRLPWASKMGEYRPLIPVIRGAVREDINPQLEVIERVLCCYFPSGLPNTSSILTYEQSTLCQRTSPQKSPLKKVKSFIEAKVLQHSIVPALQSPLYVHRHPDAIVPLGPTTAIPILLACTSTLAPKHLENQPLSS